MFSPCVCSVTQSYLTIYNPTDWNPPGSSVHGISQARVLGCHVLLQEIPDPGIEPMSPALAGRFFITVPPGKFLKGFRGPPYLDFIT